MGKRGQGGRMGGYGQHDRGWGGPDWRCPGKLGEGGGTFEMFETFEGRTAEPIIWKSEGQAERLTRILCQ